MASFRLIRQCQLKTTIVWAVTAPGSPCTPMTCYLLCPNVLAVVSWERQSKDHLTPKMGVNYFVLAAVFYPSQKPPLQSPSKTFQCDASSAATAASSPYCWEELSPQPCVTREEPDVPSPKGSLGYLRYITLLEINFTESKHPPVPSQRKSMTCELSCWCFINKLQTPNY